MPVVTIETQYERGSGALKATPARQLVEDIACKMPEWLLQATHEFWAKGTEQDVLVKLKPMDWVLHAPDLSIVVMVGIKWGVHQRHILTYMTLAINTWLDEHITHQPRPSYELEVVLTDWVGVKVDQRGIAIGEW